MTVSVQCRQRRLSTDGTVKPAVKFTCHSLLIASTSSLRYWLMTTGVEKQVSANILTACTQFTPHNTLTLPGNMSATRECDGARLHDATFTSGSASNNQGLSTAGPRTASSNFAGQPAPPARPALAPQLQVLYKQCQTLIYRQDLLSARQLLLKVLNRPSTEPSSEWRPYAMNVEG
jgi:hypothetical protein